MVTWVHTYENHVQAFMYHVKTEKSAFIDKNLLEQFRHPLCNENDHSALIYIIDKLIRHCPWCFVLKKNHVNNNETKKFRK